MITRHMCTIKNRDTITAMKTRAYLSLILAVVLWGSSFIGSKIALGHFSVCLLCMVRFVLATVFMFIVMLVSKRSFALPEKKDRKYILLSALLGIAVYYALENLGLTMTGAADASVISASYPTITVLTGILMYHEHVSRASVFGILCAFAGVVILTFAAPDGSSSLYGDLLLVADGFMWAQYNYLTQRISKDCDNITVTFWQTLAGTILFIPFLLLETPVIRDPDPAAIAAVLYLSAGCTVFALLLYNVGLRDVSADTAAALMNFMPVAGIILSALILHEAITLRHLLGTAIIIAGVMLCMKNTD